MKIITTDGKESGTIDLPKQFNEPVRIDLIQKVVTIHNSNKRQPYGSDPQAGLKVSAKLSRRRRNYRGSYGIGISRVPRKIMSRRGTRMNWQGAEVPGTVKGRKAHPPKAEKNWKKSINKKERQKAIRSALTATMDRSLVEKNHKVPKEYPFVLAKGFESISQTKKVQDILSKIGFKDELTRCSVRKIRAGHGTMRGRKYKSKVGPLLVVEDARCSLSKAGNNIPGVEVIGINNINVTSLTTGSHPGRLTLFTENALKTLKDKRLFI